MKDKNVLQRLVTELKHGLFEVESHASLLKKQIFELERHLAEDSRLAEAPADPANPNSQDCRAFAYDRLLLFGLKGPLRANQG